MGGGTGDDGMTPQLPIKYDTESLGVGNMLGLLNADYQELTSCQHT